MVPNVLVVATVDAQDGVMKKNDNSTDQAAHRIGKDGFFGCCFNANDMLIGGSENADVMVCTTDIVFIESWFAYRFGVDTIGMVWWWRTWNTDFGVGRKPPLTDTMQHIRGINMFFILLHCVCSVNVIMGITDTDYR